jgi:signal transduction histidine kinase
MRLRVVQSSYRLQQNKRLNNERNRIARDLHDDVGSHLTYLGQMLALNDPKTETKRNQQDLYRQTREAVSQTQRSVRELA